MAVVTTACPRNCYSTCTLQVTVDGGAIKRIDPLPDNKACPEGTCLKGLSYVERVVSKDRLLHPLHRRERSGNFERIGWDSALDLIVENLQRLRESPGPQSVLYYSASGTKGLLNSAGESFFRLYGGCTTTYGDLCWPAGLEATRLTLGENKHNVPWDLENARLIVLWGKNSAETNIHQMTFVQRSLEAGGRLVVIDPRRTQSAERAELLVQLRPGTDGALALGLAHLLIRNGDVHESFLEENVHGFEQFAELAQEYSPDRVERICGVGQPFLEELAETMGNVRPISICAGFGMQRYTNSGQTMRAIIALLALTGNIGKPGAGWQFANLQSHIFSEVRDPLALYPPETPDGVVRCSISTARLGRDIPAQKDPPLKMLWVERGNPVTQNPETQRVLEAIRSLEFRVVVDQFLTDTAREAHLVLPAKTFLEQTDVISAYWHPYIQIKPKVLDPPGEVRTETEIYRLLAERIDIPQDKVDALIPGPSEVEVESWLSQRLAQSSGGITLEKLRIGPCLPAGHEEVAFANLEFATPSGKIELLSNEASARWGLPELPEFSEAREGTENSPAAHLYPLHLLTPNTKNRIHSQFGNLGMIREVSSEPELMISPEDAYARGIRSGDMVRVVNERGSLILPARLDFGLRSGCVVVYNGAWIQEGAGINTLSRGRETDMGHGAAFHDNLVQVELADRIIRERPKT